MSESCASQTSFATFREAYDSGTRPFHLCLVCGRFHYGHSSAEAQARIEAFKAANTRKES